jgi:hypothetical protein
MINYPNIEDTREREAAISKGLFHISIEELQSQVAAAKEATQQRATATSSIIEGSTGQ